jgi:AcrR family transcriptional regulator
MKRTRSGHTADRFVEETVALIAEKGGLRGVNLRAVSRRVGCAHTNVYNYFADYDALLWSAYRAALTIYADFLTEGLTTSESPHRFLHTLVERLARFPWENPGLFRFISSDPLPMDQIPDDVLETVGRMKQWFVEVVALAGELEADGDVATNVADIMLAYMNGEAFDAINDRVLPDEDIPGRVVSNAMRLFTLLVAEANPEDTDSIKTSHRDIVFPELTL